MMPFHWGSKACAELIVNKVKELFATKKELEELKKRVAALETAKKDVDIFQKF